MMTINDPVTGEVLDVWAAEIDDPECWIANVRKVVTIIGSALMIDDVEVIKMLQNSDINHPIVVNGTEFWAE